MLTLVFIVVTTQPRLLLRLEDFGEVLGVRATSQLPVEFPSEDSLLVVHSDDFFYETFGHIMVIILSFTLWHYIWYSLSHYVCVTLSWRTCNLSIRVCLQIRV